MGQFFERLRILVNLVMCSAGLIVVLKGSGGFVRSAVTIVKVALSPR